MGCVNRSSKEFKDLASRHNLDTNALELIVHKYWLETGNETLFPTDVYIQSQLGNALYQEDGKNVREIWKRHYSSTKEFPTLQEVQSAFKEASRYFPKSAIYYYKNAKGNFILSVKRPVKKIKRDKEKFFYKLDNMASTSEGKTLDLNIKENQVYDINKVEELYNRFNTDRTSKDLADRVFNVAKNLGLSIVFNDVLPNSTIGRYTNDNSIIYKKSFFENDAMNNLKAPILLHEVLHAVSMYALSDSINDNELSEPLRKFKIEMNSLYQDLKINPMLKGERGILNLNEFVAELGNPVFRGKIQEIDKANKASKSFWSRVLDAFKKLLGLHTSNSYYERSMNALDKALGAFDIDTYMRYNGIKHQLRYEIANNKVSTQFNRNIDVIKDAIKSGKWTPMALKELNNLTKDLEDDKITYQRFPKEAARGWHQGGRANEIASILLGANESSSTENPRSFSEKYERDKREQPIQERIIENWAKAEGIWYDNLDNVKGKELFAEGGEAKVFANDGDTKVIKILSTEYFITPQFALDRITLHNTLFPIAPLKIIGFGRNSKGEFQFLVEQPFIQGEPATQEEIDKFITKVGFEKSQKDKGNTFISDDLYLSDLHDENVIKTPQGNLVVIDADLRLNTPDLNRNGKYKIDNSIVSMEGNNLNVNNNKYDRAIKEMGEDFQDIYNVLKREEYADSSKDEGKTTESKSLRARPNEFIKTLSDKQLDDELSLIKQESADYNLVNDVEEEHQKSNKAVPQDFTFNDGTTVKAPFRPNEQQVAALNAMSDFIKSNETSMTLSGYAGTGKTSLMEMIAKKCQKQHKPVIFCATTNKATAVLNDRVSKANFKATTLNKTFGINVEIDPNSSSYNARNLVNNLKDVDIMPGTTVIIDEASMINEENYRILNKIAKDNNLKIIYVGDQAQLAPVNEDQISKVFRNGDGKVITLTQVERTDDNAILKEATAIRNGEPLSGDTSFNSKGEGVAYISPTHQDAIDEVISHYVEGLKGNPNHFRILAYTNKAVTNYNDKVRRLLGYDSPIPHKGEPMTGYANWGYDWKKKTYRFINSESYKVTEVGKSYPKKFLMDDGRQIPLEVTPITLEDSLGHRDQFEFMDIKGNPQNRQAAMILANEKKNLWAKARQVYGRQAKAEIYAKINFIDSFLFVNDNIEDNNHNLLQAKTIDFGYAMTVHKSQGSTFANVLMDDVDISRANMKGSNGSIEVNDDIDYSKVDITSSEDVDLGSLDNVKVEEKNPNQAANVKQQLEYVGVSRATDTVTIISNNIKKEGSPLHPEKNIKEDKINDDNSRSTNNNDTPFYYEGLITPNKDTVFVFGSNPEGRHGAGAAKVAREKFGAIYGQGEGLQGNSYALPTKDLAIKFSIIDDKRQEPLVVNIDDIYYDKVNSTSNNPISLKIKKIENGNVTFAKMQWAESKRGFIREKVEGEVKTVSEAEFRKITGRDTYSYEYSNSYGFANVYNIGKRTIDGHPVFSLEISIPDDKNQGKGIGSKMYEDIIDKLASEGAYLTPGLVAATNHKWEALQKQGRLKEVILTTGEKVYIAIPKDKANLSEKRNFTLRSISEKTIINNIKEMYTVASQNPSKQFKVAYTNGLNERSLNGYTGAEMIKMFKDAGPIPSNVIFNKNWTDHWSEVPSSNNNNTTNNNNNVNNGTEYKQTDEFRRVQEGSRKLSQEQISRMRERLSDDDKRRLGGLLGRQLDTASNGGWYHHRASLTHTKKNGKTSTFNIGDVNNELFHDIFEIVRTYLKNGELVDLHDNYDNCKCFVTNDGLAGFAIEPDGNLVSVYSLNPKENGGFLYAIKDMVRKEGATHLDAYESSMQPLQEIYSKTLGFHTASSMDYNMEYDHDDIAKNHGNPNIVFMVAPEVENPKHFDKDSYDEAKEYQMQQLKEESDTTDTPTLEEGQLFAVDLPGYQQLNNLYSNVSVDATWKVPYLRELDAQLTGEHTEEENQNILNQMDNVLQATSEKDYRQELEKSKENKVDKQLDEYDKFVQQLDNLMEGGNEDYKELGCTIKATEIRHTAELIVNEISDEITRLQKEKGRAEKIFPNLNTNLDFQTATRKQIVEAVNINRLIDRVKNMFDSENADYDDLDVSMQADLITDNWGAFMTLAQDLFVFNEGFGLTRDYSNGSFKTSEATKTDVDNFNNYSNDPDVAAEQGEKDEQEKWQIDSRTVDPLTSMSALVRQGLHECYLLDENGNKVMSKWGIAERVDPREALNSILRWTQGCLSLDDMIAKLSEKQPSNPWLQQLINRLSDKSGKETDFQSQFYGVFSKDFQPYSIVLLEDGKYHVMPVNNHPALSEVMKSISAKFRIGEHSLFGLTGRINSRDLGSEETVNSSKPNLHKSYAKLSEISTSLKKGKELDDTMAKEATDSIIDACNILGFDGVTDTMLTDVINKENIKKEAEYLGYIVKDLDKALAAQKKGELKEFNPFKYGVKYGIDGSLRNFLTPITDKMEDTAVNAFYDSGKMYQSYVTPSFMTKLMKKFKQEGQKLEDFLMDEYACSEWFAYNKTPELNMVQWRNEWLRLLARDGNARKVFDHHVELNFNKHNYMRNMTDAEYTISLITEYFGESTKQNDMTPAWFRIPMLSNKPSSEFIKFYSYRGTFYKDSIVRGLHSMFLQELSRIQTVRMRNHSKNDPEFIKNFDSNGRKFNFLPVFNAYMEDNVANKAKRELLHNTVEYDEERYNELKQKEEAWQEAYKNSSVNADGSVNFSVNEDLRNIQLTQEEQAEFNALKARKEASDRALTSEEDDRFASLLQKKIKGEVALTDEEEVELGKLADKIIRQFMENRVQSILDNWEENGILESAKNIKNIYPSELNDEQANKWVREQVENFLWNDAFASKNILQLTIGDIAFYKDTEDLQKRLAQLHAPGMRGRIDAIDYDGNRVSDGKYRTFILKDFDSFKSNIIANISEVFDRKIAAASDNEKPQWIALKESLVGEEGKYTRINVTDAQGYSSPSSYRKKAFIFGRWSHDAENTYKKILEGNYTLTDFETAFQPLKPFVYSRLTKNMGVEGAPIQTMRVPFQAKNAEYLLIMADAILKGEKLSRPNLLRAVYRVMEDSERINPKMGIDTVQFESAIKSGLQNPIDIFQFRDMKGGEDEAYTYMMNQIYKKQEDKEGNRIYKDYDTDTSVHETSYENYCLQQEVPAHFKEHSQAHGSQIRMITPSDLDLYTTDENGNQVDNYYTWKEPDGTVRKVKADEFRKEYERTIAESIEESIINLSKELHLEGTKKERNLALSKILLKEISSSPRYGIDLALACQVDKETGDFRIPKGDPIQAKRIEQLINSIIKNRVNKQKIAGGPIVQVSNFGTSKQLHIRFNDRQGNLMPLEEEYNPSEHDNLSYKDYCKKNQGGIAYFEVFCPMWSDEIYQKFANQDGTINVDAINAMDPEFLKMVSYRIPTEDKYSCAPMKVVGFMPREAGDAIMFPYELTKIDDSDFDVDKRYVMRKSIPIKRKPRKDIEDALFEKATKRYAEMTKGGTRNVDIGNEVKMFMDNPERMRNTSKFMGWLYKQYQSIAYKTDAPTSGKDYRDNKIIDMTYAVLTNEMTADKILNPGGFDAPKKIAYKITAYKRLANEGYKWEDLQNMDTDELKAVSYQDKDLTFADTQVQFYKQNAASASMIGVFAVNKVAHAVLEGNDIYLDVLNNLTKKPFVIGDNVFGGKKVKDENGKDMIIIDNSLQGKMLIDGKYDRNGTLIGKTLGSLVSASADAVKDPIFNLINVNMTTVGILNTMLRLGMPFDDAAMFLSQDIIERLLSQFNRENLTNSVSLDSLINKWLDNYRKMQGLTEDSKINSEGLTMDELIEGLTPNEHNEIDYKVLLAFQRLRELTDFMRKPTFATRFNSISSAVGPLIIDNLITEHRIEGFKDTNMNGGTPFSTYDNYVNDWMPVDIDDIFTDHPILKQFSRTVDLAKDMLSDMPANSPQFRNMLGIGIEKGDRNEENIDILPSDIAEKMFDDKKLLDQFSNFYQSYLLIQSGLVNPSHLKDYAAGFPKWFMEQKFDEKYPDNALIKAIRMNIAKNTGRPYLQINITGMDEQQKEELRYAWIDLHKEDPELSKMLFDYSFFRAGIGFSPKTFMALVPSYVKERLKSKDESTSYVDTFRKLPTVVPHLVIDQFIRNNWNNNKLIPWRGGENTHYNIDIKHDRLTVYRPEDRADVENVTYIKTKAKDVVYLWHKVMSDDNGIVFERVKPLGNNGEYLEISLNDIKTPLVETLRTSEDNETSDIEETSFQDTSAEETSEPIKSETQETRSFSELADLIQKQVPTLDREGAMKRIETIQEYGPKMFKGFLQNVFKQKGLNLNEEEAINEYNKYC